MEFSSSRIYNYPAEDIWDIMSDFKALTGTFPQVTAFEETGENKVRITIQLDFGKFSGSYFADFTIHDLSRPDSIRIDGTHKSGIGGMKLTTIANINPLADNQNKLTVSGTFKRSGLVSWASKRIIKEGMEYAMTYLFDLVQERLDRMQLFSMASEEE